MKVIIAVFALVALVAAVPVEYEKKQPPQITLYKNEQSVDGYYYGFKSEDGIEREETGALNEVLDEEKKPHSVVFVRGSYTYINSEGKPETIVYEADNNGFRAFGDSIPKPVSRR